MVRFKSTDTRKAFLCPRWPVADWVVSVLGEGVYRNYVFWPDGMPSDPCPSDLKWYKDWGEIFIGGILENDVDKETLLSDLPKKEKRMVLDGVVYFVRVGKGKLTWRISAREIGSDMLPLTNVIVKEV